MSGSNSQIERGLSWASSPAVRNSMLGNKSRDTKPELIVRRLLHAAGLRYRVHARPIKDWNRKADIVFPRAKIAVFVNGCFWHGCPEHYKAPKTNIDFWEQKIGRNVQRDSETFKRLKSEGWSVMVVWEHEDLTKNAKKLAIRIRKRINSQ
ncbi:MAG: very short patch repair endonuclease [Candidatus Nanopelagicaceae bacterium]|nr:very short patch repair endonuclease [Candidatus Nanopelagicaceae bacterium]